MTYLWFRNQPGGESQWEDLWIKSFWHFVNVLRSPLIPEPPLHAPAQPPPMFWQENFQFSSVAQSCPTLCSPMNRSMPGLPLYHQLPEFTQTHVHWVGWDGHPAISSSVVPFSSCPQSLPASGSFPMSQLFTWGGQSTGVSALASFPPKNIPKISFRMDWLDLLAVQGTLKSLLQHHTSKASIRRRSAFFTVQLSHPYMTTGKP